jgi:hypothetical protein
MLPARVSLLRTLLLEALNKPSLDFSVLGNTKSNAYPVRFWQCIPALQEALY